MLLNYGELGRPGIPVFYAKCCGKIGKPGESSVEEAGVADHRLATGFLRIIQV